MLQIGLEKKYDTDKVFKWFTINVYHYSIIEMEE